MKRVFLCGFSAAFIAACTTAQTEQAQKDIGALATSLQTIAPVAGAFALPLEASAPMAASAPDAASEVAK